MPTAAVGAVRPLAAIALASAGFDLLAFAVLHVVQPGVDVLTEPTSDYVHGTLGLLSSLAAAVVGLGGLCLAAACWLLLPGVAGRIGAGLLTVFGIAKLGQAFFPIDAAGEATSAGATHNLLGNIAFFLLPVAAALLTGALGRAAGRHRPVWAVSMAGWALLGLTVLVLAADALGWFGLAQRFYLVGAAGWTALVSVWLLRPARRLVLA